MFIRVCCFRNLESACTFTAGYLGNLIILSESLLSYESRRLGGERFESVLSLLYSALFHETNSVRCEELVGKPLISKFTQSTSIPTPFSDIPEVLLYESSIHSMHSRTIYL